MSLQFGIKEVLNFTAFDYTTGAQKFYVDYASDTSITSKAERLDLRGGQGNYKLLSFDHTKDMSMTTKMPLVDLAVIGMLTNKAVTIGAVNVPVRDNLLSATQVINLSQIPVAGTLKIYAITGRDIGTEQILGLPASVVNTYSISGKVVTLNVTTAPDNTNFVATYSYSAPATTSTTTFTADKFAGYVRIVGTGLVSDQVTGATVPVVFDIKKAKAKNDFTITMNSSSATELSVDFDLYAVDLSNGSGGIDKVYVTMHALQ